MTLEELKADRDLVNQIDWSMTQEKAIEMYLEWGTGWIRGHDFVSTMGQESVYFVPYDWLRPARVTLKALDPLDPKDFPGDGAHRAMSKVVRERMARSLEELTAETCGHRQAPIPADTCQHPSLPEGKGSPTL